MRRWWLLIALLLSGGVNVGILATLLVQHAHKAAPAVHATAPGSRAGSPAGTAADSSADPRGEAAPPLPPRPNVAPLADRLGLTGDTRLRFIEIQERFIDSMREQRFRRLQLQADLRAELVSEEPDRARVEQLTKQLGEAYGSLDRALADNILASRAILTPPQQRQFLRFVQSRLDQLRGDRQPAPAPLRNRLWQPRRPQP